MKEYLKMDSCLGAVSREDWFLLSKSQSSASIEIAECASGVIAEEILHAINSHDELVAMNKELLEHLERCAKELASMIDRHNEHNMDDNSWMYDHQTPWEAMQVVIKVRGCE